MTPEEARKLQRLIYRRVKAESAYAWRGAQEPAAVRDIEQERDRSAVSLSNYIKLITKE